MARGLKSWEFFEYAHIWDTSCTNQDNPPLIDYPRKILCKLLCSINSRNNREGFCYPSKKCWALSPIVLPLKTGLQAILGGVNAMGTPTMSLFAGSYLHMCYFVITSSYISGNPAGIKLIAQLCPTQTKIYSAFYQVLEHPFSCR